MRTKRLTLALLVCATLVALATVTAGAAPSGQRTLRTAGRISALAADGTRVAIAVRGTRTPRTCDGVVVWQPATGKTTRLDGTTYCGGASGTSAGEWLAEVALAGTRVAWLEIAQGNHQERTIYTATLAKRKRQEVVWVANGNGAEGIADGDYVGNLHGDGSLLVYNAWEVCTAYPPGWETDSPMCEDVQASGDEPEEITRAQELRAIGASGGTTSVATGESSYAAQSVSNGNIATLQEDGFAVVPAAGGGIASFVAPVQGVAVSGSHTVILRPDGTLEEVSVESAVPPPRPVGAPPGTTPVLTDLYGLVAVVVAGRNVYLISLTDGKRYVISVPGTGSIDAEMEDAGLFYSYNVGGGTMRGRVVFVSLATVLAQLADG